MNADERSSATFAGWSDIRLVVTQARYEQLAFWLNPLAAMFTIGFSLVFLVMIGISAGSSRVSFLGNIKLVQYYVPGFVSYGVMAACFTTLAIAIVNRREAGLLKRQRLSPVPTWALLAGVFLSTLVVTLAQVALMLVVGRVAFGVHPPGHVGAFAVALLVGVVSFTALGVAISTLIPNADSAGPLTSVIFFVLLFLSGLWYPIKSGSGLARISSVFPIRHFITAVFDSFNPQHGTVWAWNDLLVVAAWGAVAAVIAVRRFQWAPRQGLTG